MNNSISELYSVLEAQMPWARAVSHPNIDEISYRHFMELLFASFCFCCSNSRPSNIQSLCHAQGVDLLRNACTTTKKFKTRSTDGVQLVTIGGIALELLEQYLRVLRPRVARADPPRDAEPLWLRFRGRTENQIGMKVTRCFFRLLHRKVTVARIRDLMETEKRKKRLESEVEATEIDAVSIIFDGHSSATVATRYQLRKHIAGDLVESDFGIP